MDKNCLTIPQNIIFYVWQKKECNAWSKMFIIHHLFSSKESGVHILLASQNVKCLCCEFSKMWWRLLIQLSWLKRIAEFLNLTAACLGTTCREHVTFKTHHCLLCFSSVPHWAPQNFPLFSYSCPSASARPTSKIFCVCFLNPCSPWNRCFLCRSSRGCSGGWYGLWQLWAS